MTPHNTYYQSIVKQTCPRCRTAPMFKHRPYNLSQFDEMHDHCPKCGQSFEPEPGYYTGAMYVSYAIQVVIVMITSLLITVFTKDLDLIWYVAPILTFVLVAMPYTFRLSRSIWIHLFVAYQPNAVKAIPSSSQLSN